MGRSYRGSEGERLREESREGGRGKQKSQTPSGLSEVRAQTAL